MIRNTPHLNLATLMQSLICYSIHKLFSDRMTISVWNTTIVAYLNVDKKAKSEQPAIRQSLEPCTHRIQVRRAIAELTCPVPLIVDKLHFEV